MKKQKVLIAAAAASLSVYACAVSPAKAAPWNPSVGIGFEVTSGDYGTDKNTTALFVPFTAAVEPTERLGISVEIPYVYQNNSNVIAGRFRMQGQQMTSMQKVSAAMGGAGMSGGPQSGAGSNRSGAQSGPGDITLRMAYTVVDEAGAFPKVRPSLSVKFPTADKDKGLGTGELDEALAVEVSKWFGDWYSFVEPGYTFQGKSSDLGLKDFVTCNAGVGYQVTEHFQPMFLLKAAGPPQEGSTTLLETRIKLKYHSTGHTGLEGYVAKGITTSSPDFGAGLALFYDF